MTPERSSSPSSATSDSGLQSSCSRYSYDSCSSLSLVPEFKDVPTTSPLFSVGPDEIEDPQLSDAIIVASDGQDTFKTEYDTDDDDIDDGSHVVLTSCDDEDYISSRYRRAQQPSWFEREEAHHVSKKVRRRKNLQLRSDRELRLDADREHRLRTEAHAILATDRR